MFNDALEKAVGLPTELLAAFSCLLITRHPYVASYTSTTKLFLSCLFIRSIGKLMLMDDKGELHLGNEEKVNTDLRNGTDFKTSAPSHASLRIPGASCCKLQNNLEGEIPGTTTRADKHYCNPIRNGKVDTLDTPAAVEPSDYIVSLWHVLTDTMSGLLMEDAMVTQCGHSFGISGLQHVMMTNSCLSCGAFVASNSLIPNYALRAAVLAYKKEAARKEDDPTMQAEKGGNKQMVLGNLEGSQPRGMQFPFVAKDRVIIKGNKRTPERFIGREAVITNQCLNGWYLVKMLDNGESVRLQYRSLQKMGDKETALELEARINNGRWSKSACHLDGLKACVTPNSLSPNGKGSSPFNFNSKIGATSSARGLQSQALGRVNKGRRRESYVRITDVSRACWKNGHTSGWTSSNSSQELQEGEQQVKKMLELRSLQVLDKRIEESELLYYSEDEDVRATKRIAGIGINGGGIEASGCSALECKAVGSRVWGQAEGVVDRFEMSNREGPLSAGENDIARGSHGATIQGESSRGRPKYDSPQSHSTSSPMLDSDEGDPYKKVYASGCRRRTEAVANGHRLDVVRQSPLNMDTGCCSLVPLEEQQLEAEAKASGESSGLLSTEPSCEVINEGMLALEAQIPWSCMQDYWKMRQADWLESVQSSSTVKDVGKRLHELRGALILDRAANMSNEQWAEKIGSAVETEAVDVIQQLWTRLRDDIVKLMESKLKRDRKPTSNVEVDVAKLKDLFPHLDVGGLSRLGAIAAASLAAAESYAVGKLDMEALLAVPMTLVQGHSKQDLLAVIDAIECEKRHLSAKVSNLGIGSREGKKKDTGSLSMDDAYPEDAFPLLNREAAPFTNRLVKEPNFLSKDEDDRSTDREDFISRDCDREEDDILAIRESDDEQTDLSDSE